MSRDSEASRLAIILAVWRLIAGGGVEAVTFRRVAAEAGVSVGRIQHHFGSRDDLVRAGCVAMVEGAHDVYDGLPGDPLARLEFVITHAIPDTPQIRFGTSVWYAYLAKSVDDPQIRALLAETKRGTEDECVRLIEAAHAAGQIAEVPEPRQVARRLLALADGLALRVLIADLDGAAARTSLAAELAALTG